MSSKRCGSRFRQRARKVPGLEDRCKRHDTVHHKLLRSHPPGQRLECWSSSWQSDRPGAGWSEKEPGDLISRDFGFFRLGKLTVFWRIRRSLKPSLHSMKTYFQPPADAYLNDFLFPDPVTQRQHDPVFGCLELGLPQQALDYLTSDPEKQMASGKLEALRLLALEQAGASSENLARQAVQSSLAYPDNLQILETACIHLASSEQYQRLFHLFRTHPQHHHIRHHSSILHNLAAAAAQTGRFKSGLAYAFKSALNNMASPSNLLIDLQMRPLWEHYATAFFGDPTEARWMCSPSMFRVLDQAIQRASGSLAVCEFTLRRCVPSEFHQYLQRDLSSYFVLSVGTPSHVRLAYRSWMNAQRTVGIQVFKAALNNALNYLRCAKQTQPEQRGFCYE
jgi:hypothetical protein